MQINLHLSPIDVKPVEPTAALNDQAQLAKELGEIHNSEMWQAGAASRALRPKQSDKVIAKGTKGVGGRAAN